MDSGEWIRLILIMAGTLLATAVVVGVGAYVFLRVFAHLLNSRQAGWESSAPLLGLTIDRGSGGIHKTFTGERDGFKFEVNRIPLNQRMSGKVVVVDEGAEVKLFLTQSPNFSFEITKRELLYQQLNAFLAARGIGHEPFDNTFEVTTSDRGALVDLLHLEMLDAESSTFLTDLMLAAKKYHQVKVTHESITIGGLADLGESDKIDSMIKRAIHLAARLQSADSKLEAKRAEA